MGVENRRISLAINESVKQHKERPKIDLIFSLEI